MQNGIYRPYIRWGKIKMLTLLKFEEEERTVNLTQRWENNIKNTHWKNTLRGYRIDSSVTK